MGKDVIIALDFDSKEKTLAFLDRFTGKKPFVKIGMELFYAEGPSIVREIKARGHQIFLDLKLHDIPNTVKKAMAVLSSLDVDMVNLHAAGTRAMMTAAQLGLEPNTPLGQAYLIPFWNGKAKCLECQFQLGYKGLIDLAYRSGEVSTIQANVVYENDEFEYELGLEPKLRHVPAKSDRGDPVFFYAVFRTKDGGYGFDVMSVDDVRAHAKKYSKAYSNGPWQTNFEEMAKKTVLKRVLKYAPLKSDFVRAVAADETIKTKIDADMYSVPDETVIEAESYEVDESTGEVVEDRHED